MIFVEVSNFDKGGQQRYEFSGDDSCVFVKYL